MPDEQSLDDFLDEYHEQHPPHAVVERVGRWTYVVAVESGMTRWGARGYGWFVLGRKRADRKARKVLRRYHRDQARLAERYEIREDA
jgi:hypothetical protein